MSDDIKTMTDRHTIAVSEVRDRVERIAARRNDDEAAHAMEDELYRDVLRAIAAGVPEETARAIAAEALKTSAIDFNRWTS